MGYTHVDPDGLPAAPDRPCTRRSLTDACGFEQFAAHVYEADPGEEIPLAYHYHDRQEELFYVTAGELHVETPAAEYVVAAGEAFGVEPESPQFASVPADGVATTVLAVGAPPVDDAHPYQPA